jgi:hypothetical protein
VRNAGDGLDRTVFADDQAVFGVFSLCHLGQHLKGRAYIFNEGIDHFRHRIIRAHPAQYAIQKEEEEYPFKSILDDSLSSFKLEPEEFDISKLPYQRNKTELLHFSDENQWHMDHFSCEEGRFDINRGKDIFKKCHEIIDIDEDEEPDAPNSIEALRRRLGNTKGY